MNTPCASSYAFWGAKKIELNFLVEVYSYNEHRVSDLIRGTPKFVFFFFKE